MAKARIALHKAAPEVRFWACFVVVLALLSQALFPAQVMAQPGPGGTHFVLCTEQTDAAPVIDQASAKLFKALKHKPATYQGLKCPNCVLASITAIAVPAPVALPAIYRTQTLTLTPGTGTRNVQARAPPRPHSCGPPSEI